MLKKIISEKLYLKKLHGMLIKLLVFFVKPLKSLIKIFNKLIIFRTVAFYFLPSDKLIIQNIEKTKFILNSSDLVNSKKIFIRQSFPQYKEFCKAIDILETDGYRVRSLVEVGSHYGNIVIPAVKNFKLNKAYAFEPINENYEILNMNISINKLEKQIISKELFVSDITGVSKLYTFLNNSAASVSVDNLNSESTKTYTNINNLAIDSVNEVETVRLEDEVNFKDLEKPIYWLYAQGSEYNIINGSRELFKNSPPLVIAYAPLLYKSKKLDSENFYTLLTDLNYTRVFDLYSDYNKSERISSNYFSSLDEKLSDSSSMRLLLIR
tara:strand:- start:372 stop:1343 length:972 start_codon:yes stop_codon:yes gene_type:complete